MLITMTLHISRPCELVVQTIPCKRIYGNPVPNAAKEGEEPLVTTSGQNCNVPEESTVLTGLPLVTCLSPAGPENMVPFYLMSEPLKVRDTCIFLL